MPYNTVRDPGTAKLFGVLGDIFTPNPQPMIEADLAAKRRDLILSQTEGQNLSNTQRQKYMTATEKAQALIAANPDLARPENRAQLAAATLGMEGGLQHSPAYNAGVSTFVQPNFANEKDLSTILLGSGVIKDYGSTPDGQQRGFADAQTRQQMVNDAAWDRQLLNNAGAMDREVYKANHPTASTPNDVTPGGLNALTDILVERLTGDGGLYPLSLIHI